jgi:hypothetical protein
LAWGEGDTVWGKSYQGHLYHLGLDFNSGTAAVLHVYPNLPSLAPIELDPSHQLLGAVSIAQPDALRLFSLANLASGPIALDTESFPSDQSSSPAVGAVTFGAHRVYALDPNHGILAMSLRPFLQYSRAAQLLTLSWAGSATLQSAPNVSGPYQDIAGSISPVTVDMSTNGPQYFRLRNGL